MGSSVIFSLLLLSTIVAHQSSANQNVASYSERQVLDYVVGLSRNREISKRCAASLRKIPSFLHANNTLVQQRDFYHNSFARGDASQFISRDLDKWFFKSMECLKVAGEMSYSASEYPVDYCFGMNRKQPDQVYGICIPSLCEDDRQILLRQWQSTTSSGKDNTLLDHSDCTKSRYDRQWYVNPISVTNFTIDSFISLLICLAAIYEIKKHGKSKSVSGQILISFSFINNLKKLLQLSKNVKSTITCMFGLRFFCMVWTLVGHSFYIVQSFLSNADEFRADLTDNFWNQAITNFTLGVDLFFTLSGILTSYSWFNKWYLNKHQVKPGFRSFAYWLRFYRHRLFRLWPAYLYAITMLTTRLSYTHWHPVFSPTDPAIQCSQHWYKNAFFFNSIFGSMCMPWTWYISAELIFYLLSPLFLLTLYRSQFAGVLLIGGTIFASSLANAVTMYSYNLPPIPLSWGTRGTFDDNFLSYHFLLYIKPWNRIGPYLIGLLLGYYLVVRSIYDDKESFKSFRFVCSAWLLAGLALFWSLFGAFPAIQGWDCPLYHLFYGSVHRTVFSLGISWLVYACHCGHARLLNGFLSLWVFLPLSSLSYSVYLIHMSAIVFTFLLSPFPIVYTGKVAIFIHCLIQLIISYAMGIRIALAAELPALAIEKTLLNHRTDLKPAELDDNAETRKLKSNAKLSQS